VKSNIVIAAGIVIALANGQAPTMVQLLPMGTIRMSDGRGPYQLDDLAHAARVIAATRQRLGGRHFNFDFDHQAIAAAKIAGATAPASGWIDPATLVARDDGIWGTVEWTPAAAAAIAAREYRYTSPVFHVDAANRVTFLCNAALTNNPAIDMAAVVASEAAGEPMLKNIAMALGLAEDADEAAILEAIMKLAGATSTPAPEIAAALKLPANATAAQIVAAIGAASTAVDPTKFVPVGTFEQLRGRLDVLEGDRIAASVDAAIAGGKLAPADRQWGLDFAKGDRAAWDRWSAGAPVIASAQSQTGDRRIEPVTTLTADEIAACEMIGLNQADFLKAKNEELTNGAR